MKSTCLTVVAVALAGSLLGSPYYDSVTNLVHEAVRTNVCLYVNQQAATNGLAGQLLKASFEGGFNDANAITNTLSRLLGSGTSAGTAASTNAAPKTSSGVEGLLNLFQRRSSGRK